MVIADGFESLHLAKEVPVKFPGQHMHLETTTAHEAPSTSVGEADGPGC